MGEPAELGTKDLVAMRALAEAIIDGTRSDTADPHEVIVTFAMDNNVPISTLLLQLAQAMRLCQEEAENCPNCNGTS